MSTSSHHNNHKELEAENAALHQRITTLEHTIEQIINQQTDMRHLLHGRNLFRAIFDTITDGLLLLDHRGTIQAVNRAFASLLGRSPDNLYARHWATVCNAAAAQPSEGRRTFPGLWALDVLRDGQTRQQRELFCAADGVPMTLEMQALPIAAPDEAADPAVPVAYVVLHVVDVTEKLQLEALMLENERLEMGRKLTQLFAHEVNTPLQTILLSLEHLPTADDEERSWFVSLMRQEIQRIGALLHQFAHVYQDDADEQASDDEDQPDEYD